jgi:hypothetical protein
MNSSMRRRVSITLYAAAIAALTLAPACSRKAADEPPVATPSVSLGHDKVPIGSPVKVTYKFTVAPNAPDIIKGEDYVVFVHVLDPTGEQLWTDDHPPVPATSTWKPGQTVEYTRTVFVPNYPYIGEAAMRIGLYNPASGKRLTLSAQEASRKEYVVAKFQLLPQSENIFLIYKDGWHAAEVATDNAASEWQWTKKTATISFRNPKKDLTFYLEWDARPDLFTPPQQVTVSLGGQTIGKFVADNREKKMMTFPITAAQLGTGDMAEVVLSVDRTFTPGGGDTRELGIRVFHAFVETR